MRTKNSRKTALKAVIITSAAALITGGMFAIEPQHTAHADTAVEITNAQALAGMTNGNYILTSDITLDTWTPLAFTGTLNGNGHTITTPAPLFSTMTGAQISRLALTPSPNFEYAITASLGAPTTFGLLAQSAQSSHISETYITGGTISVTTTTGAQIGTLLGTASGGTTINNTYSRASLTISQPTATTEPLTLSIGGLAGTLDGANIHNSYTAPAETTLATFTAQPTSANITLNLGGLAGKAQSSGYDIIINNFTGGNFSIDAPLTTTKYIGTIFGSALGYDSDTLTHNSTYNQENHPYLGTSNYTPTTFTTQHAQYFQTPIIYTTDHAPSIWHNVNQTYMWDLARTWCKSTSSTDFLNLQMFEEFTIEISQVNNGTGVTAKLQQLSGTEFVDTDPAKTSFNYADTVRICLEITSDFLPYKNISGLKRVGDSGLTSGLVVAADKKTATYDFTVDGSTAGAFYGITENVQYKLKLQTDNPAEGTIRYGTAGGSISSEPYIMEYGKKEYTFYAAPTSNAYAFESWTWVGVTDNPTQNLPENRLINIKFGTTGEDSAVTYITMPTEIPTTIDADGAVVFTLQANFTANVCNLEISSSLNEEGFELYVGGVRVENIVDMSSFYNESIQVNKPIEIKVVMLEGYKFVRWEDNSGRDISKAIESGESATSMLIHLSASGDFSLGLVIEAEDKVALDLTWLWYVLGGIGGAGLVVLIIFLIKNRKRRENFLQYY